MAASPQLPSSYQTACSSTASFIPSPPADSPAPVTGQARCGRTIIFLGAPTRSAILHTKLPKLLEDAELLDAFRDRNDSNGTDVVPTVASATSEHAAWRILPLKRKRLPTGLSQKSSVDLNTPIIPPAESGDETSSTESSFSSTAPAAGSSEDINRSFAVHNVPSTPVHMSTSSVDTSFISTTDGSFTSHAEPNSCLPVIPPIGMLTDLRNLPNARYLTSIQPQTMSISVIVGIISIPPVRHIVTKKFHKPLMFQTLLVGDETAAGFKVDIWIPLTATTSAGRDLKEMIDSLRLQDVLLIENLGLGVWNDKVNGATLRKDRTKIKLAYRVNQFGSRERRKWGNVDLESSGGDHGLEKVRRVVEWAQNFVDPGRAKRSKGPRGGGDAERESILKEDCRGEETQLPDDTQY